MRFNEAHEWSQHNALYTATNCADAILNYLLCIQVAATAGPKFYKADKRLAKKKKTFPQTRRVPKFSGRLDEHKEHKFGLKKKNL